MIGAGRLPGQFYERDCLTRQIQVQLDGAAGATEGALDGAAGATDGPAVVTAGAGVEDSVGIATGRDRPLSSDGDSRWSTATASITRAPVAILEDVPERLPARASDAPTIQSCMAI